MVKCWDLEANKVIRHYHGHLSGVYSLSLHPTLDVLVTAGRDASARVWDMRTKAQIHVLTGHTGTVADVKCQESDPQVVTGSMDSTVRYVFRSFSTQKRTLADFSPLFWKKDSGISRQAKRWSL
jgi:pleiotropic regulator 1